MNIRSITAFIEQPDAEDIAQMGEVLARAKAAVQNTGILVQTTRIATGPLAEYAATPGDVVLLARSLEAAAQAAGIDYAAIGPVRLSDDPAYIAALPEVFAATENVFASVEIATREHGIDPQRARLAADLIRAVSVITPDGFSNLKLTASANVGPWGPFFPAAYHGGGSPRIAAATESANLAVDALSGTESLRVARQRLIGVIEGAATALETALDAVLGESGVAFHGIDFSLAPFPDEARSIGRALEALGLPAFGLSGSLAASAWLTDTLDRAQFRRAGFCGMMMPVLEDAGLATRAADGSLGVRDLLTASAVCGTGLDTIPLPGDIPTGALAALLLDVGALALRLNKPLTARLMPLPGKQAGDETGFTFEYFTNTRVMALDGSAIGAPLNGDERILIGTRSDRTHQ